MPLKIDEGNPLELTASALRQIADWLDLTDEYMRDTIDLLVDNEDTQYIRRRLVNDNMQTDIRRWADEMELDN